MRAHARVCDFFFFLKFLPDFRLQSPGSQGWKSNYPLVSLSHARTHARTQPQLLSSRFSRISPHPSRHSDSCALRNALPLTGVPTRRVSVRARAGRRVSAQCSRGDFIFFFRVVSDLHHLPSRAALSLFSLYRALRPRERAIASPCCTHSYILSLSRCTRHPSTHRHARPHAGESHVLSLKGSRAPAHPDTHTATHTLTCAAK